MCSVMQNERQIGTGLCPYARASTSLYQFCDILDCQYRIPELKDYCDKFGLTSCCEQGSRLEKVLEK